MSQTAWMPRKILQAFASLRLTVTLLALSMVLIFVGTLAQATHGVWQTVDAYFRSPVAWIELQLFVPHPTAQVPGAIPFPGGLTIGLLLIVNLLAAHTLRFRLVGKRIGIVVLHAGLIILLVGEFATGMFAREGLMSIDEGGSSNYVEDIRTVELAAIDSPDGKVDRVVAIPQGMIEDAIRGGTPLAPKELPFSITIDRWLPNARLLRAMGPTPANRGIGLDALAEEVPQARGVDGAQTNSPAAYVTLRREGEDLGTWLLAADLIDPQTIDIDGKPYGLALRFKRTYMPYRIHLIEFRHDKFVGTEVARNFSSRVRIEDPRRGTDREALIWMNNPLRYAGETFYQASYKPDGSGTVLQVVRNPGAMLPYIACLLVGGGLTLHFVLALVGFLRRQAAREQKERAAACPGPGMPPARVVLPWVVGALGLLIACSGLLRPAPRTEFDVSGFAHLPVSAGGRVKPMDTQARHVLMVAGGRQSIRAEGGVVSASQFLLALMADPESIRDYPIVRVDHPDVLALMDLPPEEGGRITLAKIEPHWESITEQASRAFDIPAKRRDPFQRAIVSLSDRVSTLLAHSSMVAPYAIPPIGEGGEWRPFHDAFMESGMIVSAQTAGTTPRLHPAVASFISMMTAYGERDAPAFNGALASYQALLWRDMPDVMRKARHEVLFNRASLFLGASAVYVLAFLLACGAILLRMRATPIGGRWGNLPESLRVSSVSLMIAALLVHTLAIAFRIYLQERPPVTNLYSSAVFVGWAAVLIGVFLERLHPMGVATLGAASVGFATLVVAHNLGSDGDTMQMMQAVLDSNFWLATHVIIITLGYSATFLAGVLAAMYLLMGVFTRFLARERATALSRMVYGVVCFALLLSFVGTVLGGIWADQSWGRFWGWDPKENGAALVVLINAIILHARWGGIIRDRGIMVLAVGGNIVTAWSWFGTNMLGIGLHSYGFMDAAAFWMLAFVVSQLGIMAIGLTPLAAWRSRLPHG